LPFTQVKHGKSFRTWLAIARANRYKYCGTTVQYILVVCHRALESAESSVQSTERAKRKKIMSIRIETVFARALPDLKNFGAPVDFAAIKKKDDE